MLLTPVGRGISPNRTWVPHIMDLYQRSKNGLHVPFVTEIFESVATTLNAQDLQSYHEGHTVQRLILPMDVAFCDEWKGMEQQQPLSGTRSLPKNPSGAWHPSAVAGQMLEFAPYFNEVFGPSQPDKQEKEFSGITNA